MGQEACQVKMHIALVALGLEGVLIGHDEIAQTVHHVHEHRVVLENNNRHFTPLSA